MELVNIHDVVWCAEGFMLLICIPLYGDRLSASYVNSLSHYLKGDQLYPYQCTPQLLYAATIVMHTLWSVLFKVANSSNKFHVHFSDEKVNTTNITLSEPQYIMYV